MTQNITETYLCDPTRQLSSIRNLSTNNPIITSKKSQYQKYGLMCYNESYNLGDEIQSIAAKQFIPHIDYLIDRNTGNITNLSTNSSEKLEEEIIKVIYNGWFDGQYCKFPPIPTSSDQMKNIQIDPLYISFHVNEQDHTNDKTFSFLNKKKIKYVPIPSNVQYLQKFGPIGCRDIHTTNLLYSKGIPAYFSGCLTLTLKNPFYTRNNEILVVDAHIACLQLFREIIPEEIRNKASYICQAVEKVLPHQEKMKLAQKLLDRIARAKLVITSRLHTTMPCLAFDTPVIFLNNNMQDVRFNGLINFVKSYTHGQKLDINLNEYAQKPVQKSVELIKLIDSLKKKVKNWIGPDCPYDNEDDLKRYLNLDKETYKETDLENFDNNNHDLEGYSIFSVCMNRNSQLERSLPSWISTKPNEIVIVDWGSQPPIKEIIDRFVDELKRKGSSIKIKLIVVTNVDKWVLTKSFNLAARFTRYKYILKVDCDSLLKENFFLYHNLHVDSVFFAGDWTKARNDNEKHTNGIVFMKWSDFKKVGLYNEYIVTYGYDDCDLYKRLEKNSRRFLINLDTVQHIEHSNIERLLNQSLNYRLDIEIEKNRLISEMNLWKPDSYLSTFNVLKSYSGFSTSGSEFYAKILKSVELSNDQKDLTLTQAIKNREYTRQFQNHRKKFYINVKNGLGNRLRALASAYNIAQATNRQLILIWTSDFHCDAKFTQLFKLNYLFNDVIIIEDEDNIEIIDAIEYKISENEYIIGDKVVYNYVGFNGKYIDDTTHNNIYVVSACVLNSQHTDWYKESDFLKRLEIIDDIASQIYSFEMNNNMPEMIGIHIRMGQPADIAKYEDISAYSETAKASMIKWRNNSHYSKFLDEMDKIITENPKQIFFLCCDNQDAYKAILNLNKYNISYVNKIIYDRSLEQVKTAIVDIMLLSKTKYLLGSNWSSFTEIVGRLSGRKTKLVGVDF